MEQDHQAAYDFRQYDKIWQRVAPQLEPYPAPTSAALPAATVQESQLPGAEQDPCCMGTAAAEMLQVLTGFIEEELGDQRYYLALARQAPAWARQGLRDIAADEGGHAQRLTAVHYLITGESYRPAVSCERIYIGRWCPALRERYHAETCGGLNYARAADGTTDPCLEKLLRQLSDDEYRHARTLMALLARSLRP
jgi:hypothetical protein